MRANQITLEHRALQASDRSTNIYSDAQIGWPSFKRRPLEIGLIVAYIALISWALSRHAMWGDEIQAWLIARDSANVWDLFKNLRYEGHPALWHLLLMPLTRLSLNPITMQIFHATIATAVVAVVLWYAPLTRLEKILFPFGYFVVYEYAIKSRSYSIGFLLVTIFCILWKDRNKRKIEIAITLALLSNVHILLTIMSGAAALAVAIDQYINNGRSLRLNRIDYLAVMILLLGWAISVITAVPAAGSMYQQGWFPDLSRDVVLYVLMKVGGVFGASHFPAFTYGGGLVLILSLFWLRRRPSIAIFLFVSVAGILTFLLGKYLGHVWHQGLVFVALFAAIWMDRTARPGGGLPSKPLIPSVILPAVLAVQVCAGIFALSQNHTRPLSHASNVAALLFANGWEKNPIFATRDFPALGIVGLVQAKSAYYGNGRRWGSFAIWDKQRLVPFDLDQTLSEAGKINGPVLLISVIGPSADGQPVYDQNMNLDKLSAAGFREVTRFDGAVEPIENYIVFRREH